MQLNIIIEGISIKKIRVRKIKSLIFIVRKNEKY